MMIGLRGPALLVASVFGVALFSVFGLRATGEDLGEVWRDVAFPMAVLAGCFSVAALVLGATVVNRIRNRRRRPIARYQLVLSQADEATTNEVAAACEQLVQAARQSMTERLTKGQPWLALESWFVPAQHAGETGIAALMLLCPPAARDGALAALRRAYPDLTLRHDPASGTGEPLEFPQPSFVPGHVLRVRKARSWALPLAGGERDSSNARSTMAAIVRQQQQLGRLSCVRWCLTPAPDQFDSRAAERLERLAGRVHNAARAGDIQQALQSAGGAMSFLELQAAVEAEAELGRSGRRLESFSELQNVCHQLLSPALSQRGANHLTERLMVFRQRLYRRRFARGEPPLIPDLTGSTLVSPRELAALVELPSLGSEHALPLQRNTVPNLPIPTEVPRAELADLPMPPHQADSADEVVDGEVVCEEPAA